MCYIESNIHLNILCRLKYSPQFSMQTQIFTSIFYADSNIHLNFLCSLKYSPQFPMQTQIFT